jgi:hypothetical protein
MNAKESREAAFKINTDASNSQYAGVKKEIAKAVAKGDFQTNVYESLKYGVKTKLEEEGYHIYEHSDQRDGITITITW